MVSRSRQNTPPTSPIRTFEENVDRVAQLIDIHTVLAPGPGKPAQWRSDIAAAAIVMTIAAVDTYFGDRRRADFERRFEVLDNKQFARIVARILGVVEGVATKPDSYIPLAKALQSGQPKGELLKEFAALVDGGTYQEPSKVAAALEWFGVERCWNHVSSAWGKRYVGRTPWIRCSASGQCGGTGLPTSADDRAPPIEESQAHAMGRTPHASKRWNAWTSFANWSVWSIST